MDQMWETVSHIIDSSHIRYIKALVDCPRVRAAPHCVASHIFLTA